MSLNYKSPLYVDTDSIKENYLFTEAQRFLKQEIEKQNQRGMKTMLNSTYGLIVTNQKENDMRIKDFIVLHADGQPVMVKKEAIAVISKMSDGTTRVDTGNQIWITDDKYEDVIKRLFEV